MPNKIFSLADARKFARRRMPRMTFDYIDGSAGDERARALNVEKIEALRMLPRVLVNAKSNPGDKPPQTVVGS